MIVSRIGIDVSKAHLDVSIDQGKVFRTPNTDEGFRQLLQKLPAESHVHLESSGGYERRVRRALRQAGHNVSTHDPLKVRRIAQAGPRRGKTDALDARLLSRAGSLLPAQPEKSPEREALCDLSRAIDSLKDDVAKLKVQSKAPELDPVVQEAYARVIRSTGLEIEKLEQEFKRRVKTSGQAERYKLALSVPGVGPSLARVAVSELPEELGTTAQTASYAGVAPLDRQSGQTRQPSRIGRGNSRLKAALYMPALSCVRRFDWAKDHYARLRARGRTHQQAMVAVMRRLLVRLAAVLKRGSPWQDAPAGT